MAIMPDEMIDDIKKRGRQSIYWTRESALPPRNEPEALKQPAESIPFRRFTKADKIAYARKMTAREAQDRAGAKALAAELRAEIDAFPARRIREGMRGRCRLKSNRRKLKQ